MIKGKKHIKLCWWVIFAPSIGPGDMDSDKIHQKRRQATQCSRKCHCYLKCEMKGEKTPEMSDTSIWTFDQFLNSQLSCHVLILYAKPISDNTVESQCDRLKINEPVNANALCYCLTAHFVKYSISGKQTLDPWTFSFTSPWSVFTQMPDVLS